jgi:hypothetical protein
VFDKQAVEDCVHHLGWLLIRGREAPPVCVCWLLLCWLLLCWLLLCWLLLCWSMLCWQRPGTRACVPDAPSV